MLTFYTKNTTNKIIDMEILFNEVWYFLILLCERRFLYNFVRPKQTQGNNITYT